jgi:hypothetical protein
MLSVYTDVFDHYTYLCSPFHLPKTMQLSRSALLREYPSSAVASLTEVPAQKLWTSLLALFGNIANGERYCYTAFETQPESTCLVECIH